jgi:lysosomal acid lipase/cholesteryl ester hydrolase
MHNKETSQAFSIVDEGYDLWLPNSRGNKYSRKHESLKSSDPKFWNFSFEEIGIYDVPAVFNYIEKVTGHR